MHDPATIDSLTALGLTNLEARIYILLLQDSPITGYAIAKALGKPAANVYKAISSLETKGAVEVDRDRKRLCRPVPVAQLLASLERRFKQHRDQAADGLRNLPGPARDTRIYQLRDADQVLDRCRAMIASATSLVLLDLFPEPLALLAPDLAAAAARGVPVTVKTYSPCEIEGVQIHVEPTGEKIQRRWPAQWLHLIVDGSALVLAMLTADGKNVVQAFHSESPFLSWVQSSALGGEICFAAARNMLPGHVTPERWGEFEAIYHRVHQDDAPGYLLLRDQLERAGGPPSPAEPQDDDS